MIPATIRLFVLDADVWEVDPVVEVRQVLSTGPVLDFARRAIRSPVSVVAIAIALVQPLLVVTLQLVVQDHAIDAVATLGQALRFPEVRAKHLDVMFDFPRLLQLRVEGLLARLSGVAMAVMGVVVAMALEELPGVLREDDDGFAMAIEALGADQALFTEMSQITHAWIGLPAIVVVEVTRRDHPKGADGCERAAFRAAQGVLMHDFPLVMTGEVKLAREDVARIGASGARVSVAVRPARVLAGISLRLISAEGLRPALAVAVDRRAVRPPCVVIGTDVTERMMVIVAAPLDLKAVVARIEITRVQIHTAILLGSNTGVEWLYER